MARQSLKSWRVVQCRDDMTAIELFLAGVQSWEAALQRFFLRLPDDKRP
jgi:hypothetical protein